MKRSFTKFVARLDSIGLRPDVEKRSLSHHVSLQDLYEGTDRAPSIVAARRDVYTWLMKKGKGNNEIARLFDRAPSGVQRLTRGRNGA
jgi:hypothetical protein